MKPLNAADPTVVGSYRLLGVIGGGGMGRVYLGQSPTGRRLAVKVIRADLAEDPVFRQRFAREVAAVRAVSPLFTAAIVDADTDAPAPWLATTYIDGPSLDEWVGRHGPLSPGAVRMLGAGLAEALASIHTGGLVHRDLKPSNVLLDDEGPRIIDFGIAITAGATRLTTSFVGTPSYTPPECIRGAEASPAGDVFALGATLVFASTGRKLVDEGTMYQQVTQITSGRFDLSEVPKPLRAILVRCLSRQPRDRPSAGELSRILIGPGIAAPAPGWYRSAEPVPPLPVRRMSRRRVLAWSGAFGVAFAGSGVGAAAAFEGDTPPRGTGSPVPGTVLWQALSGMRAPGVPVIVDRGQRLITVDGSGVYAVDLAGHRVWTRPVPDPAPVVRQWGDAVLVTDPRRAWLLDAATGTQVFAADLAGAEEAAQPGADRSGRPVQINEIALSPDRAFIDVGTALIALDRTGRQLWRRPRLAASGAGQPSPSTPKVADRTRLVTQDLAGGVGQVGLYDAATGTSQWSTRYALSPAGPSRPPPGGTGPPGAPGPPPVPDESWQRSESRLGPDFVALRDARDVQVVRVSDGRTVWKMSSVTPIAAIEVIGDLVLVSADKLTAWALADGAPAWQSPVRGARIAVSPDGNTVAVAAGGSVMGLDASGRTRWSAPLPEAVRGGLPERVGIDGRTAFVTFRPRPDQPASLAADVIAVAVG